MPISTSFPASSVALLTLNRPEAANALSRALAEELAAAFSALPEATRAVVLTGAGEKAFSAGADLKERQGMDHAAWEAQHRALRDARDAILECSVPVIAAVNGAAYGGGCELALACDFIYASDQARFALTEASLGIMPGMGGVQLLAAAIGEKRAAEMLLTARPIDAKTAYEWGLANHIFPPAQLLPEVLAAATRIAENAPLAIDAIRRRLNSLQLSSLDEELDMYRTLLPTADRHEGINAYNEKRKAQFKGE